MNILPIAPFRAANCAQNLMTLKKEEKPSSPSFTGIFPCRSPLNNKNYVRISKSDPQFFSMLGHTTDIFREVETEIGLSQILSPDKKTKIKVLGCSDGSEAYSYAMAMAEGMGEEKAKKNVSVLGVDLSPEMVECAKTGCLVLSDRPIDIGNKERSEMGNKYKTLAMQKYLKKTERPEGFCELLQKYPALKFVENDPASNTSIGNGLDWYEVQTDKIPEVKFAKGDMVDFLGSTEGAEVEVYVLANSVIYLLNRSKEAFLDVFREIKEANKGKNKEVYVIIGDTEENVLNSPPDKEYPNTTHKDKALIKKEISSLGYENPFEFKLRKKNIADYKKTSSKIYKLTEEKPKTGKKRK